MSKQLGVLASGELFGGYWSHCKTSAEGPDDDRIVLRNGIRVGRIVRDRSGRGPGAWCWYGMWAGSPSSGECETFQACFKELWACAPEDDQR